VGARRPSHPAGGIQSGGRCLRHHGPDTRGGPHSGANDPSPPTWWIGSVPLSPALRTSPLRQPRIPPCARRRRRSGLLTGPALLRPQWEALHEGAGDPWKSELCEVNPDRLGHIAEAQGTYTRHAAKLRFDALLSSYDAGSGAGKRDRTRVLSCACRPPRLGWTLSRSCIPWRSRTEKYKPPSAIATASQCCLSMPRP
jgi:hypothetical protein